MYVSAIISYSLAYDATDVMDNYNLPTELSTKIQITMSLIGTVRKPVIEPIFLAKRWSITPEKAEKTIKATV